MPMNFFISIIQQFSPFQCVLREAIFCFRIVYMWTNSRPFENANFTNQIAQTRPRAAMWIVSDDKFVLKNKYISMLSFVFDFVRWGGVAQFLFNIRRMRLHLGNRIRLNFSVQGVWGGNECG